MAHRARYTAAMTAITRRLPFGLSEVIEPNMLGYLLINLGTFCIDLGLLGFFHGTVKLPLPVAVTLSYGTASLISYVFNRVFNFRSHAQVGRQLPLFVAVSVSNYLIFVLGLTDLLAAVGVYYELARVLAACCEGVYLYCMMRWVIFRDTAEPYVAEPDVAEPYVAAPYAAEHGGTEHGGTEHGGTEHGGTEHDARGTDSTSKPTETVTGPVAGPG